MIICIALGMGVPCVPAYVVTGVITLPIMNKLGFTGLGPHLFILYYAVIASVTPPVAVSAYAAASIAGSNPMSTAFTAARVAFVGFVVPFMLLFNDSLLLIGGFGGIMISIALACMVVILGAMGLIGYYRNKLGPLMRSLCFAGCAGCIYLIVS
jgi:TRAP-type uncharacterized transport system fused permease subunit